jgi:hypothetical protein
MSHGQAIAVQDRNSLQETSGEAAAKPQNKPILPAKAKARPDKGKDKDKNDRKDKAPAPDLPHAPLAKPKRKAEAAPAPPQEQKRARQEAIKKETQRNHEMDKEGDYYSDEYSEYSYYVSYSEEEGHPHVSAQSKHRARTPTTRRTHGRKEKIGRSDSPGARRHHRRTDHGKGNKHFKEGTDFKHNRHKHKQRGAEANLSRHGERNAGPATPPRHDRSQQSSSFRERRHPPDEGKNKGQHHRRDSRSRTPRPVRPRTGRQAAHRASLGYDPVEDYLESIPDRLLPKPDLGRSKGIMRRLPNFIRRCAAERHTSFAEEMDRLTKAAEARGTSARTFFKHEIDITSQAAISAAAAAPAIGGTEDEAAKVHNKG